jgi:hypothetical protein
MTGWSIPLCRGNTRMKNFTITFFALLLLLSFCALSLHPRLIYNLGAMKYMFAMLDTCFYSLRYTLTDSSNALIMRERERERLRLTASIHRHARILTFFYQHYKLIYTLIRTTVTGSPTHNNGLSVTRRSTFIDNRKHILGSSGAQMTKEIVITLRGYLFLCAQEITLVRTGVCSHALRKLFLYAQECTPPQRTGKIQRKGYSIKKINTNLY